MAELRATDLIVVRHGETVWNEIGKQQGWLDAELSKLGLAQAEAIADALTGEHVDALYSSDLGRAIQTAEIIARRLGLKVLSDVRLRERHLGIMQGMTMAEFQQKHPQAHARFCSGDADYCLPGGESVRQRYDRNIACAEDLTNRHAGQRLLIVAHGGILNSFFRRATGQNIASPRRFSLFNASINAFSIIDGQWRLDRWGNTHHLKHLDTKDDW